MSRWKPLVAALALACSGCVTWTVAESVEVPRGEFAGVEQAWLEPGRLVVQARRGRDQQTTLPVGVSFRSHWDGWTLTYPLDAGSDEPLSIEHARPLTLEEPIGDGEPSPSPWPLPLPPGAVPVEVLDSGPYGFTGTVLLEGRPRRVQLRYAPSTTERRVFTALLPLAVAADLALVPLYLLVGIPFGIYVALS